MRRRACARRLPSQAARARVPWSCAPRPACAGCCGRAARRRPGACCSARCSQASARGSRPAMLSRQGASRRNRMPSSRPPFPQAARRRWARAQSARIRPHAQSPLGFRKIDVIGGSNAMRKSLIGLGGLAAALLATAPAAAQGTIKIGVILPYSGQFADGAAQLDNAIKLYVKQHGDTVAGKKLEFIRKDTGGIAPDVAKRLAQELIVRDKVDILAGFLLTPNALAGGDISNEAKKFMVVMNAATAIITTKSPYMVRTSLTTPQVNAPLGTWAYKSGIRKVYTMASDYGPGLDAEGAFSGAFKAAGGEVIGTVKMAVANPDYNPKPSCRPCGYRSC